LAPIVGNFMFGAEGDNKVLVNDGRNWNKDKLPPGSPTEPRGSTASASRSFSTTPRHFAEFPMQWHEGLGQNARCFVLKIKLPFRARCEVALAGGGAGLAALLPRLAQSRVPSWQQGRRGAIRKGGFSCGISFPITLATNCESVARAHYIQRATTSD